MIKLINVCKEFNGRQVLNNINLEVQSGETMAIIGGSGSGKSTLLKLMIGLIHPTSGKILIDGQDIAAMNDDELDEVRLKMGMVFQYSALFDSMSVGENVAFGLRERMDYSEERIQAIVKEKLELVGLPGREDFMPGELSGAQEI